MSAFPATLPSAPPVAVFDDDAWDDLLNFVEERRVIPIVGPELVTIQTEAGPENLYTWLARSLAARLNLPPAPGGQPATLNDVVVRHLANRGRREDVYARIRSILRDATFAPSPALLKLAAITDFNLYVSTTFVHGLICRCLDTGPVKRRGIHPFNPLPAQFEPHATRAPHDPANT